MKFQIKHECRGRIRVQMCQPRMTLEQADLLENWLQALPQVERAAVHERTRCAIIEYKAGRRSFFALCTDFLTRTGPLRNCPISTAAGL